MYIVKKNKFTQTQKKKKKEEEEEKEERKEKAVTKHEKIKLDLIHKEEVVTNSPVVSLPFRSLKHLLIVLG